MKTMEVNFGYTPYEEDIKKIVKKRGVLYFEKSKKCSKGLSIFWAYKDKKGKNHYGFAYDIRDAKRQLFSRHGFI